jgi:sugar-specific transcriptional regulator TrmB
MQEQSWESILEELFHLLGLSSKEAVVYRTLLEMGTSDVASLVTRTGLKRGITYTVLYSLARQKLVKQLTKNKKTTFQAEHPKSLLDMMNRQKNQMEHLEENIHSLYPKLSSMYKLSVGKPSVRYFEGEDGILEVFEDIYAPKKDIVYGCVDLEKADRSFPSYIMKRLIPKRIKNGVQAHSIIGDSKNARTLQKQDSKQLRTSILIDKKDYPLPAEIDIYEDKVAMLSFVKGEFIGVIIENADIAESLRSIFRLAFGSTSK